MDRPQILDYLEKRFPEYQSLEVSNLMTIAAGWETKIQGFSIEYNEDKKNVKVDWIIRRYHGEHAKQKAKREFEILSGLRGIGYPVPAVRVLEKNSTHLGAPFIMMDWIHGQTMADFIKTQPLKYEEMLALFSQLFVNLHRLDYAIVTKMHNDFICDNPFYWIKRSLDDYEHQIETFHKIEFYPVLEWLRECMRNVPCKNPSLTHRDFHPNNILLDEDQNSYVIDWTAWDITDFRVDLGWTLLLHGAFTGRNFRDETLKAYENTAKIQVENIDYFEVLAGLRRMLDVSISFSEGASKMSMREDALVAMRESLEHMTYVHDLIEDYTDIEIPRIEELIEDKS